MGRQVGRLQVEHLPFQEVVQEKRPETCCSPRQRPRLQCRQADSRARQEDHPEPGIPVNGMREWQEKRVEWCSAGAGMLAGMGGSEVAVGRW